MKRKPSVKFIIKKDKNDFFTGFRFLDKIINDLEDSHEFEIPNDKFKGTNNSLCSEIELFNKNKISKKCLINIYICRNIFQLYLSKLGYTFEMIFLDYPDFLEIRKGGIGYEFDDNGNSHRVRISLINYNNSMIDFNKFYFSPLKYCNYPDSVKTNDYNSYQLSIYSKNKVVSRPNELFNPSIDVENFYNKYNDEIKQSYDELMKILKKDKFEADDLQSIAKKKISINNHFNKLEFHKSKSELEKAFNDEKYVEFFYQILVHKLLICIKFKDSEHLKEVLNNFHQFKVKLDSDKELHIYQKVFGLIQYNYIYRKYNCSNTIYIKTKDAKKNSIIYQALEFFKGFISNLDEDSPAFFKLLEINSKYGYSNESAIYNFSLLNVEDIKEHLTELIPEVIYFFEQDTSTKAFVFSMTGTLGINKKYLFQNYKEMNLIENYDEKEKENAENISMIIARYLMHEECGHSKFRNKSGIKTGVSSPIKCISKGKIKILTNLSNKEESDDLIKIFPVDKNGKGDSGHYLETSFGKYKGRYIITYFDRLKDVGKLLKFPEYFVKKEKLEILGEYLFLKCHIELKNINLKLYDTSNLNLESEICLMYRLLEKEQPKIFLKEKKQKPANPTKGIINKKDNNSLKIQEENENESCFTEENVLRDIDTDSFDFKEKEGKEGKEEKEEKEEKEQIYLRRKRNMKYDNDNNQIINISKEEIEEILKEIREEKDKNTNYLKYDINKLKNLDELKITYDDYIESEDDEARI